MFTDAGVGMLAPMLYQVESRQHYDFILKDWHGYMKPDQVNLVCGDQVDDFWHQKQGPLELHRRMVQAHEQFIDGGRTLGAFWHDISRAALVGNLGPYSGLEWALAGGAAFSKVRDTWRVYPLRAHLQAPKDLGAGGRVRMQVALENISKVPLRHVQIAPVPLGLIKYQPAKAREIVQLEPGAKLLVPWEASVSGAAPERKNRFMVGFRITWPAADYGKGFDADLPRVILLMPDDYIQP